jgi:hypothetical protein
MLTVIRKEVKACVVVSECKAIKTRLRKTDLGMAHAGPSVLVQRMDALRRGACRTG